MVTTRRVGDREHWDCFLSDWNTKEHYRVFPLHLICMVDHRSAPAAVSKERNRAWQALLEVIRPPLREAPGQRSCPTCAHSSPSRSLIDIAQLQHDLTWASFGLDHSDLPS